MAKRKFFDVVCCIDIKKSIFRKIENKPKENINNIFELNLLDDDYWEYPSRNTIPKDINEYKKINFYEDEQNRLKKKFNIE